MASLLHIIALILLGIFFNPAPPTTNNNLYIPLLIAIYTKIYGNENHPSIANTLYSIAQQYFKLGQYQTALDEFKRILGEDYF